ncbi:MAG: superoxide dismutase family protein, partial [Candidatus Rokubacteria bacterium]|nr:superoxide dismutase family protein [Candidatus Rokubacteria bacterium]
MRTLSLLVGAMFLVAGCAGMQSGATSATAELKNAQGQIVGTATLTEVASGVRIVVEARGLPAGEKGVHLHAVGKCDPPAFTSAGGHFNPEGKKHGLQSPDGPHAGDLPNLAIAANGSGRLETTNTRASLGGGASSLFDADGSAVVIHAAADDMRTDPTGNSGGRIACGVIV